MPKGQQTIPARSEVLRWAREASGYTQSEAAGLLGLREAELAAIESGDMPVASAVFQRMMNVYHQVESVLLLPYPPPTDPLPADYRTVGIAPASLTPETLLVIREARRIQHYVSDLVEEEKELFPRPEIPGASLSDNPERVADGERERFGITVHMQQRWERNEEAFDRWRARTQELGVLVLLKKMQWEDCRGLSLWNQELVPVIVVNSEDAHSARIFTLFHEYAHLLLRESGVCVTEPTLTHRGQVERWCNSFAANFLVPSDDLRRVVENRFPSMRSADWTMKDIQRLATTFRVSRYVMARRLKELGISDFLDTNIHELRRFDKKPTRERTQPGGVRPEVQRLSEVGTGVASVVMDAWKQRLIDAGDAADILNLRTEDLGRFEERAERKRTRRGA
jgi:Zn-dependent peptidase ImmA (M78 family)